jgi:hypothetical protein
MEKLFLFIYVTLAFSCLDLVPQIQAFFPEFVVAGLKLSSVHLSFSLLEPCFPSFLFQVAAPRFHFFTVQVLSFVASLLSAIVPLISFFFSLGFQAHGKIPVQGSAATRARPSARRSRSVPAPSVCGHAPLQERAQESTADLVIFFRAHRA